MILQGVIGKSWCRRERRPASGPHPLPVNENGGIAVSFVQPVLGPAMTIIVHNDSSSDARLTISAYLAN